MQFHPLEEYLKAKSNRLCVTGDLSENKLTRPIVPNNYSNAMKPPQPANARGEAQSSDAEIPFFYHGFHPESKNMFLADQISSSYFSFLPYLWEENSKDLQVTRNL